MHRRCKQCRSRRYVPLSMGRDPRVQFADAVYHLTVRGNNRRRIFLDDRDRGSLLSLLRGTVLHLGWRCHAYCLMGNHWHVVVQTPRPNLASGMCRINGLYSRLFNQRHGRCNHLFGGRYGHRLIERDSHFLEACRYVVMNPVRAGLCETAEEWRWSSFQATAGLQRVPDWLDAARLLNAFARDPVIARDDYSKFIAAGSRTASLDELLAG